MMDGVAILCVLVLFVLVASFMLRCVISMVKKNVTSVCFAQKQKEGIVEWLRDGGYFVTNREVSLRRWWL